MCDDEKATKRRKLPRKAMYLIASLGTMVPLLVQFIIFHSKEAIPSPLSIQSEPTSFIWFFVMSSTLIERKRYKNKNLYNERGLSILRTWGRPFARSRSLFFVVEQSPSARVEFNHCVENVEPGGWNMVRCAEEEDLEAQILLTSCDNSYWGVTGPCCKCESALLYYLDAGAPSRWVAYSDDDMYFVPEPFLVFLSRFDPKVAQVLGPGGPLSPFKFYRKGRRPGHCDQDSGAKSVTLQPAILSRRALRQVATGIDRRGITKSCAAFNSTHDAGLSVFLWQYSIGLQRDLGQSVLSNLEKAKERDFPAENYVLHRVKFERDFNLVHRKFGGNGTYNNEFDEGSTRLTKAALSAENLPSPPPLLTFNERNGYQETEHSRRHGTQLYDWRTPWPTFHPSDCVGV